jgi:hemerythrin-like domain-containing protein
MPSCLYGLYQAKAIVNRSAIPAALVTWRRNMTMGIFEVLRQDHEMMRQLFKRIRKDRGIFEELKKHLEVHHRNEEKILYDLMVTKKETRKDSMEAVEEHRVIDLLLRGLEDFPRDHERWPIKFEVFQEYTEHHFKEEEDDIFPSGAKVLVEAEMRDMGARFAAITERQLAIL